MMINIDLKTFFDENDIIRFDKPYIENFKELNPSVKRVLLETGMPSGAAPEFQFFKKFVEYKEGYVVIGDGIDFNKILLDISSGEVFEESGSNKLRPINTHIKELVYTLHIYAEMVDSAISENGNEAYLSNNIPDSLIERFKLSLLDADSESLKEGAFWDIEIKRLLSHIADE